MPAYYNEIDRYCCDWLSNLMDAGQITPGKIDDRSIHDVFPDDVAGYERAHFFAGIAGWDVALTLAGWGKRPVWTGSCPCQPFSAAGAGKAADDERHLWPDWCRLIRACRPPVVFGEQVEAAIGWGWLDLVQADLVSQGYATGFAVLPAASVGAPHIRNRLWFVADANSERGRGQGEQLRKAERGPFRTVRADAGGAGSQAAGRVADDDHRGRAVEPPPRLHDHRQPGHDADGCGVSFWSSALWLPCTDGKARPVEPGIQCLAHGVQRRPSKLRAYGNAIVPPLAAEFIKAAMDG